MGWLYLLGALIFPPVFILWRPRSRVPPERLRLRIAGAVVVVWMLMILWSIRGTIAEGAADVEVERSATTQETSTNWQAEASGETSLIMMLGWVPGLVYAGLLMLARKAMEPQEAEVIEGNQWRQGEP